MLHRLDVERELIAQGALQVLLGLH